MEYKFLSFRKGRIKSRSNEVIYSFNSVLDLTVKRGDVQIKRQITLKYAVQMHKQLGIPYLAFPDSFQWCSVTGRGAMGTNIGSSV